MEISDFLKAVMHNAANEILAAMLSVCLNATLNREEALASFREGWKALSEDMDRKAAYAIDECLKQLTERQAAAQASRPPGAPVH